MFLNETKPDLDDVLEHHGVKGQKWGVRRQAHISAIGRRINTHKEVAFDLRKMNKLEKMDGRQHPGIRAKRSAQKDLIESKKARSKNYAASYQRQTSAGRAQAKSLLRFYVSFKLAELALTGHASVPGARFMNSSAKGSTFVRSNPGMMSAKLSDGVYKVTNI